MSMDYLARSKFFLNEYFIKKTSLQYIISFNILFLFFFFIYVSYEYIEYNLSKGKKLTFIWDINIL